VGVTIPDQYRVGHEAHFAQVTKQFFEYLKRPETFPAWENPNLAKYYVSTKGVEMAGLASLAGPGARGRRASLAPGRRVAPPRRNAGS
jgi:hypothetical protein